MNYAWKPLWFAPIYMQARNIILFNTGIHAYVGEKRGKRRKMVIQTHPFVASPRNYTPRRTRDIGYFHSKPVVINYCMISQFGNWFMALALSRHKHRYTTPIYFWVNVRVPATDVCNAIHNTPPLPCLGPGSACTHGPTRTCRAGIPTFYIIIYLFVYKSYTC